MRGLVKGLIIIVVILAIIVGALSYVYTDKTGPLQTSLNAKVLVLCVDPSEGRPGPGSVDMAFNFNFTDGNITNITPIYPGGMKHPTAAAPEEVQAQGLDVLVLHDSLWWNNTTYDAQMAQEIVEYNTGIKTDVVVMVKPAAIDAILQAMGGVNINGTLVTDNSIEFMRNEQSNGSMSRGNAVEKVGYAIKNAYRNESNRAAIRNAIMEQYHQGNIIVVPDDFVNKFLTADAINKVFE